MTDTKLTVLFVTNMYPDRIRPNFGIFVKEQIEELGDHLQSYSLVNVSRPGVGPFQYLMALPSVLHHILAGRFNILHVHFGLTAVAVLPLLLLIKALRIRTVITFHGTDVIGKSRFVTTVSRLAARFFDLSICVSDEILRAISTRAKRSVKIPCGISDDFLSDRPKADRQSVLIFPSDPKRKEKNFGLFERIFSRIRQQFPQVSHICLQNLTKKEVVAQMDRAKCLVMTSMHEGSPQTVKEAIACDLPVVSTPVGDVPRLLEGLPGCAIGKNEDELVKAVLNVLTAPDDYQYPVDYKTKLSNSESCRMILKSYQQLAN